MSVAQEPGSRVGSFEAKDGQHLDVERSIRTEEGAEFFVSMTDKYGSYFAKEDAPALALAVLEAAGYEHDGVGVHIERALYRLRMAIREQAAAAQEAADREALESEAQQLYASAMSNVGYTAYHLLGESVKEDWRRVARAARKLHQKEAEQ